MNHASSFDNYRFNESQETLYNRCEDKNALCEKILDTLMRFRHLQKKEIRNLLSFTNFILNKKSIWSDKDISAKMLSLAKLCEATKQEDPLRAQLLQTAECLIKNSNAAVYLDHDADINNLYWKHRISGYLHYRLKEIQKNLFDLSRPLYFTINCCTLVCFLIFSGYKFSNIFVSSQKL